MVSPRALAEILQAKDVGQQVEVSGTLRAEEQVATSGVAVEKPAKGIDATPTVETKTELDVKEMTVSAVKPSGQRCAPDGLRSPAVTRCSASPSIRGVIARLSEPPG